MEKTNAETKLFKKRFKNGSFSVMCDTREQVFAFGKWIEKNNIGRSIELRDCEDGMIWDCDGTYFTTEEIIDGYWFHNLIIDK